MIELKQISFSYGNVPALKDISLCFKPGTLYAVVGPNGSGKTTLIKLLSRQGKPKSGKLLLDGKAYECFGRKAFAQKTALLPQGRNTPNTSVRELVSCGRYPWLGVSRTLTAQDMEITEAALAQTGTAEFAARNLKTLSGGQRQRVYLAMLLAQDTPYVLLDEPTTYLDIGSGFEIMEQLVQMKRAGKCVIAVLHDLPLALKYADQIVLMDRGNLLSCLSPQDTQQCGLLEKVFAVKCTPVELQGKTEYLFDK